MIHISPNKDDDWVRLVCVCYGDDHYMELSRSVDKISEESFVDYNIGVQHNQHTLWHRIKMAIRIILKKRVYTDVTLNKNQMKKIHSHIGRWLNKDKDLG